MLVVLWLSVAVVTACARLPEGSLTPLSPEELDGIVALRQPSAGDDPVEHARALAQAEQALRRPERAAAAARTMLLRAESAWWMARLWQDPDAVRRTRRRLDGVARDALRWGARTDDPQLTAMAVLLHPHPRRHRRALRQALAQWEPTGLVRPERLLELVGDDAEARHQIVRSMAWNADERERLGLTELSSERGAIDLLAGDLHRAVLRHASVSELERRAAAVREVDPWHLDARLTALLVDELAAGTLSLDATLVGDVVGPAASQYEVAHPRQARLTLRARATPNSDALVLALAWLLLEHDLVGDAHAVLEAMDTPTAPAALELREHLQAMTAARRGRVASFERWRIEGEIRSVSVDEWLSDFEDPVYGDLQLAARRARRRVARAGITPAGSSAWMLLLDDHLDESVRARARRSIFTDPGRVRAWELICRERGYDGQACASLWSWEDPSASLHAVEHSRHLHPGMLSAAYQLEAEGLVAVASVIDGYEGTVVEATPDAQMARLRLDLARGRYADARARLEQRGALLWPHDRTWGWLVLDDLEAGRTSFDETTDAWRPSFRIEVVPSSREDEVPVTRAERYTEGMLEAFAGDDARALELLRSVIDEVPDEAVVDALAQAALSAHRLGDAAGRDALRHRLRAADPHGVPFALLEAHLSSGADRPQQAREFLAHALRWHPTESSLHDALVSSFELGPAPAEADALAFVSDVAPLVELGDDGLRRAVARSRVSMLDDLNQLRRALDGDLEAAWAIEPARLPDLLEAVTPAVEYGEQRVGEAADVVEARSWAAQTLARLDGVEVTSDWQRRRVLWLALVTGATEPALALARQRDARGRFEPMSEAEAIMMLLRSRAAGELDDAQAWDLWRWFQIDHDDASARIEASLLAPPAGTIFEAFACGELTTREDLGSAFAVCEQAWRNQPDEPNVVGARLFLALNHSDPEVAKRMADEALGGAVSKPDFEQRPDLASTEGVAWAWHHNRAVWYGEQGQHEVAAEAWWQAYALGLSDDEAGRTNGFEQLRWRGPQVRALLPRDESTARELHIQRATLALTAAQPPAALGYAEAARSLVPQERGTLTRDQLMMPDRLRHLARWAHDDLQAGRIPPEAMPEMTEQVITTEPSPAATLHERYPESSLARLARAQAYLQLDEPSSARELVDALLERHPDDPLAASVAVPQRVAVGQDDAARALFDAADAANPDDALLRYIDAPESITGPRDGVPAWVRDPERFDARLATVTEDEMLGLLPVRHASDERAAELFVSRTWSPVAERPLRFVDDHGARVLVLTSPRASRCQGAECASDLLEGLAGAGRTRQWTRQTRLAGGDATQALFSNAEEILVTWVLPSGGRVFTLVVAAPVDRFDSIRPALVMARDGFRPLDAVLPPFAAESLRAAGPRLRDGWRLRARLEQGRATTEGCSVPQTLAALPHDHQRAEMLVDLWLATADPQARRSLLGCTGSREATARRLALVALLDEDPRTHAFGLRAARTHSTRVESDVRTIASTPLTPPVSSPDYLTRADLPGRGLVEVLGALPLPSARRLADRLLASADPRDRSLAWA
ncbi:MAG: tetratricopeptide repeat protein, partial [Nannocystaceae bacterium]